MKTTYGILDEEDISVKPITLFLATLSQKSKNYINDIAK